MNKNDYSNLEDQIGNEGMDGPRGLGKIRVPGQRPELDAEEKTSMTEFLNKGKTERNTKSQEPVSVEDGWIPVNRNELAGRSDFYPDSWEFFVRAATVQSIRNWVAVDEGNTLQVNRVLNEIIRSNVRIDTNDVHPAGWQSIRSWDRFWFVLKVREATFARGDSKIEFEDSCSECDSDLTFTLNSSSLGFTCPDEDVMKYWNGTTWEIDPTEYDVEGTPIILYPPTLGKDENIIMWAQYKAQNNEKIDENFITYLPWMFEKPFTELDQINRQFTRLYKNYKGWSIDKAELMEMIIRNIAVTPSDKLIQTCPNCKNEVHSTVRFPDGIKKLFRTESKVKTFGSR